MINTQSALLYGKTHLEKTSPSPRIDAEVLLAKVLETTKTILYTYPEVILTPPQWAKYEDFIAQRALGHPIAHLTGSREFWSLPLMVSADTLIPRPETELLVELTLQELGSIQIARVLDLGTGSGAIALALASERPEWLIQASDVSEKALAVAQKNALNLNLKPIQFIQSNWFEFIPVQVFHAIVSNPPYISENDSHLLEGDVRFEPKSALTSGPSGLDAIRMILSKAKRYLVPRGALFIEHGHDQKHEVESIFKQTGYDGICCYQDFSGHDRVTVGFSKGE